MEQGTVSGCVLDISRLLGCSKVLFVGQDMCEMTASISMTQLMLIVVHYVEQPKGHRLPGNTSDEVVVEGRLFVYLKTFEKFIKENPHINYRNLARTGVKVEGAPYMNYDEAGIGLVINPLVYFLMKS